MYASRMEWEYKDSALDGNPVTTTTSGKDFAQQFADAWATPTPEGLVALLHPDVTLLQPHLPPIHGKQAAL